MKQTITSPETWVSLYGNYLYSFALYRIQDESTAQELVQETLVSALKTKDSFKGTSSEKTWLTGILRHKIIDTLRKKYREPVMDDTFLDHQTTDDHFDNNGEWAAGPARWKGNPEKLIEQKAFLDIIQQCLSQLPEKPRHALHLKEIEGESTQNICKVLNVSSTNCWVILHRARSLMRTCVEKKWFNPSK